MVVEPQGVLTCWSSGLVVWVDSGPFLGLLLSFGVPESFTHLTNPGVPLRVGHQHTHIWPIRVHFMHYYSAFWGPEAISTIDEPRGAFTSRSSALTILADSRLFRALLLSVLES